MNSQAPKFSSIVLAGGRSARMGRPKAALRFGEATMLERVVAELARASAEIVIVAAPESAADPIALPSAARIIRDERAFEGPALALARGLDSIENDAAFACSCDLPLIDSRVASALVARLGGYDAVIPIIDEIPQPLHAAYHRRCAGAMRDLAQSGNRLTSIGERVRSISVYPAELAGIGTGLLSFTNVNTPEDYSSALARVLCNKGN